MKFATLLKFTEQGVQGVEQTAQRAEKFREDAENADVHISELLWLQGPYDGLIVFTAPNEETAVVAMLKLARSGNVRTETMLAFDADSISRIVKNV